MYIVHWLKHDLPVFNHTRVALSSIEKTHLKKTADHIQDLTSENNNSEYIQWYLIWLDIIELKLYTEKPVPRQKSIPKYKSDIDFTNKVLDRILQSRKIINSPPDFIEQDNNLMAIYTLTQFLRFNIFNYHIFVKNLNITSSVETPNTVPCQCSIFHPKCIDKITNTSYLVF